jgi:hypothetical protein
MQPGTPRRRWSRIFRPDARTEVEDELSFHIEQRVQDNIARGMDAEAARAAAICSTCARSARSCCRPNGARKPGVTS